MTAVILHAMLAEVGWLSIMAKASTTCALRLAAASVLVLFLLAVPHLMVSAEAETHRSRPEAVAFKPYVDENTGRVKLLRPARVQVRAPRNQDFLSVGKGHFSKDLRFAQAGPHASNWRPVPGRPRVLSQSPPFQVLVRTRNPRDPPDAI